MVYCNINLYSTLKGKFPNQKIKSGKIKLINFLINFKYFLFFFYYKPTNKLTKLLNEIEPFFKKSKKKTLCVTAVVYLTILFFSYFKYYQQNTFAVILILNKKNILVY